ncbi:OmpA family protein [archaeon]|nr:OmpA family protein [archaeon]
MKKIIITSILGTILSISSFAQDLNKSAVFELESNSQELKPTVERINKLEIPIVIAPRPINHYSVYFQSGSSKLLSKDYNLLDRNVRLLNPTKVEIFGYTDNTGTETKNLELSNERVDSVAEALSVLGLNRDVITKSIGYGNTKTICSAKNKSCNEQSRRVDINIEYIK